MLKLLNNENKDFMQTMYNYKYYMLNIIMQSII